MHSFAADSWYLMFGLDIDKRRYLLKCMQLNPITFGFFTAAAVKDYYCVQDSSSVQLVATKYICKGVL